MNSTVAMNRIGAAFKIFGYLCFGITIAVIFYHDSRHLPTRPISAFFYGFLPGLVSWLVGWAIQRSAKTD